MSPIENAYGNLPFTGGPELPLMALAAVLLILIGVALAIRVAQ